MPNWATNLVTIEGDKDTLDEIQKRLATPYKEYYRDIISREVVENERTGEFLLWNIRQPINLSAYWENDKPTKISEAHKSGEQEDIVASVLDDLAHGEGWYAWNVRNWGTKWEIGDAYLSRTDTKLSYSFDTAWSPIIPAMDTLAKMYPDATMRISAYDESMDWAVTVEYINGVGMELEADITHEFLVDEMGDDCSRCGELYEEYDDNDRREFGCPSTNAE